VNYPDLADYYRLVTDDAHPNQYFFDGQWRAFETRDFTIAVKTDAGVVQQPRSLRFSVLGPVFETADGVIALRAAGVGDVRGVEQYYRMSRARDFAAWKRALAMQAVPSTNIVYADREGHIALIYNARFPDRAADARYDWQGCLPGDDPAALWTRYLPADAAPRLIDPASGWVYSANASPFSASDADADMAPAAFPASMGIERWMTNRARRAVEQLAPQEKISDESLLAAKFDITYSEHSVVGETITMLTGLEVGNDAELRAAQDLLRGWDRRASADSRVMALAYAAITPFAQARFGRRAPPEDALAALRAAAAQTKASFGRLDPLWGDVLRLRRGAVDLPLEGGPDLLRAVTFGAASDGKLVGVHGDGLIIVVDWAPDGSVRTRTISQFGAAAERPRSPHYNDQAALFAQYKFRYDVTEPSR
jgi:penicillin amidase/acyl-homoserine-lactone acylase